MPTYTIVAIYTEPFGQRFATSVEAAGPREAELAAVAEADAGLIIAGVLEGEHQMVDVYTDGYSFGVPGEPEL